ncbi:putative serine/threonine-protein kinase PBL22 [Bidens hawaiensis]|uniref:putative serine/threonine-protein kinase PBL22 n=1 Tax=Bidens hawaiensis TaxID=980011 RepID=UPI00404AC079
MAERTSQNSVFRMEAKMSPLTAQLCRQFSLDEILSATQNFDDALVVGEGGFGKVYKATFNVENGETFTVAVKRLDSGSNQGAPEFWAEIEMLTKLRHCNLVSLIGYCNDDSEMILVYEFMPNGTLDDHLHRKGTNLSWVQRLVISIGAARGLHYLHTGTGTQHGVIHRDVKSSNILLDEDYAAKISDFGLSKIGPTNTSGAYVNTLVRGTFGYLDPEYFLTERLTRKSDVFAFGVVLFELLCGRAALDNNLDDDRCSLAKWAHESIEKGIVNEIIDLNIKSQISPKCLKVYVQIADRCLNSESKKRPTMAEILAALELSLALQNKFESRLKSAPGIFSFARMIKWPFISPEVNSAHTDTKPSTINEDTIEHSSSSKEAPSREMLDHLNHVAAQSKSLDKSNINHASLSKEHSDLKVFSFGELQKATRNFILHRRLGVGEFGEVFEGWMYTNTSSLSDCRLRIVIKRFFHPKIQYPLNEKFVDLTLSEFNHPNLVKVLGYCFKGKQLFLIYEFMENGSLHTHLFSKDKIPLPWKTRVQILVGIAEALSFLHRTQKQIDNHPIRLNQILLDKTFNAKISDFEAAKLVYRYSHKKDIIDPLYYPPQFSKFL